MRITLDIDRDVLDAAKKRARREGKTAGQVISELLRTAFTTAAPPKSVREPAAVYGFRPFAPGEQIVTDSLIDELRLDDRFTQVIGSIDRAPGRTDTVTATVSVHPNEVPVNADGSAQVTVITTLLRFAPSAAAAPTSCVEVRVPKP